MGSIITSVSLVSFRHSITPFNRGTIHTLSFHRQPPVSWKPLRDRSTQKRTWIHSQHILSHTTLAPIHQREWAFCHKWVERMLKKETLGDQIACAHTKIYMDNHMRRHEKIYLLQWWHLFHSDTQKHNPPDGAFMNTPGNTNVSQYFDETWKQQELS